jgi:TolA-binding protein
MACGGQSFYPLSEDLQMRTFFRVLMVVALVAGVGSVTWVASSIGQESETPTTLQVGDDEAGRLPPGYTIVVTDAQRSRIYAIQDSYSAQIADLQKQITQIEGKRDLEIAALLDDEQKTVVSYVLKLRERQRSQRAKTAASGGN